MSRAVQVTLESSVIFHSVWKTVMVQMLHWKVQLKKIPQVLLFLQVQRFHLGRVQRGTGKVL